MKNSYRKNLMNAIMGESRALVGDWDNRKKKTVLGGKGKLTAAKKSRMARLMKLREMASPKKK